MNVKVAAAVRNSGGFVAQRQNILVATRKRVCRGPDRHRIAVHTQEAVAPF